MADADSLSSDDVHTASLHEVMRVFSLDNSGQ